jgi:Phage integrase family
MRLSVCGPSTACGSPAIDLAVAERCDGPIFVGADGLRLDRHAGAASCACVARKAGITKRVGPHTLRHAFITAALDAGVPLSDVQEAASHADPRTTMRYHRARVSLDRHAPYIVATFLAGAARQVAIRSARSGRRNAPEQYACVPSLLELRPVEEIEAFFASKQLPVSVQDRSASPMSSRRAARRNCARPSKASISS